MKNFLLLGILLSNFIFANWFPWEKRQMELKDQDGNVMKENFTIKSSITENEKYMGRKTSVELMKVDNTIWFVLAFGEHELPYSNSTQGHMLKCKVDNNQEIELFGTVRNYVINVQADQEEDLNILIDQMKKGKILKITTTTTNGEKIMKIPLKSFNKVYRKL